MMLDAVRKLMDPALRRIALMVARGALELVNDDSALQTLQVSLLADELRSNVERAQQYGFTSHPVPGADVVALALAGSRDNMVVIAVDDRRYRLQGLAQGEVAIYTDEGDKIVLQRGGTVEVTASTKVRLITPTVECTGDLVVAGKVTATGNIDSGATITAAANIRDLGGAKTMAGMRGAYNNHHHGSSPVPDAGM